MSKTCWFSTSVFRAFGLDLGVFWASKMSQDGSQTWGRTLQKPSSDKCLKKMASWRPLGFILEASGPRFWRLRDHLFRKIHIWTPKNDRRVYQDISSNGFEYPNMIGGFFMPFPPIDSQPLDWELAENLPRSCAACGRLPSIAELLWPRSVGPRSFEGGWGGGGPPQGGCN